jgi:hypothetical protein
MPWKTEGKIGHLYPDYAGDGRFDTTNIIYCADGTTATSALVEKVYYIPPGVTSLTINDLPQYGVWRRYWENPPAQLELVRGSDGVLIEYIPSSNITLNSFGIFEDNGNTSFTNDNFRIFNEAGIQLAFLGTGTVISNEVVKYGLTGHIRTGNMGSVQLEAGKKYYFLFQTDTYNSSNATPAMFYDEEGIIRQTYTAVSDTQTDTYNLTGLNNDLGYIGGTTAISEFITSNNGDYMTWNTAASDATAYNQFNANTVYVRSDSLTGLTGDYVGKIGYQDQYEPILEIDTDDMFAWDGYGTSLSNVMLYQKNNVLDSTKYISNVDNISKVLSADINSNFVYRPSNYDGILTIGHIYKKNFNAVNAFNTSRMNDEAFAELLLNSGFSGNTDEIFSTVGFCGWGQNSILSRTGIGSVEFTDLTPVNATAVTNKVDDGLYYLSGTWEDPVKVRGVYYYEQSSDSFKVLFDKNYTSDLTNINRFVTSSTISAKCTDYDVTALVTEMNPNLMMAASAYVQPEFTETTFGNARYYLEINGQEVNTPT